MSTVTVWAGSDLQLTPAGERIREQAQRRAGPIYAEFAKRLEGKEVRAACAALSAYLEGSELAAVVRRRLAE
jgi:hypothetical protein